MPFEFIAVTTTDKTTVAKLGDVITVDNDDDLLPTVWKPGPSNTVDITPGALGSVFHPECPIPVASFTVDEPGAENVPSEFTDTSINTPTSWLWDFGDGNTSTEQNPTHQYAIAGDYTVTLTVSNNCGTSEAVSEEITVTGPVAVILFEDNFNGALGTNIQAHTPDIAPDDWGLWDAPTQGTIQLTGTGRAWSTNNGDSIVAIAGSAQALTYPYLIEVIADPLNSGILDEGVTVTLASGGNYVRIIVIHRGGPNDLIARVSSANGHSSTYTLPDYNEVNVKVRVNAANSLSLYINDVLVSVTASGPAFNAITGVESIEMQLSAEATEASRLLIGIIKLTQEYL